MAQFTFTLDQQQYEALIGLAREGTKDANGQVIHEKALRLEEFLRSIENNSGITRYLLWVQWQELDEPLPAGTRFPDVWPPEKRARIEQVTRPISRSDIDQVIKENARKPTSILVTRDPGARYGWMPVEDYT